MNILGERCHYWNLLPTTSVSVPGLELLGVCKASRRAAQKEAPQFAAYHPLHEKAWPALIPASPRWLQPPPHPEGLPPTSGAGTLLCPLHDEERVTRHPPRVTRLQVAGLGLEHGVPACLLSATPHQPRRQLYRDSPQTHSALPCHSTWNPSAGGTSSGRSYLPCNLSQPPAGSGSGPASSSIKKAQWLVYLTGLGEFSVNVHYRNCFRYCL